MSCYEHVFNQKLYEIVVDFMSVSLKTIHSCCLFLFIFDQIVGSLHNSTPSPAPNRVEVQLEALKEFGTFRIYLF